MITRKRAINSAHRRSSDNADSKACSLPLELLAMIFKSLIAETTLPPDEVDFEHPILLPWLSQVMHCCSMWRQAALATSSLWTLISLTTSRRCKQRTQFMLRHSKASLLTIIAYKVLSGTTFGKGQWPLTWILPEAGRIKSLYLDSTILDATTITVGRTLSTAWPALRTLVVDKGFRYRTEQGEVTFAVLLASVASTSPIAVLEADIPHTVTCLTLIRGTLTRLVLYGIGYGSHLLPAGISALSNLQSLSIEIQFYDTACFNDPIHLPSLHSLQLEGLPRSCAAFLRNLSIQRLSAAQRLLFHLSTFQDSGQVGENITNLVSVVAAKLDSWLPDSLDMNEGNIEYTLSDPLIAGYRSSWIAMGLHCSSVGADIKLLVADHRDRFVSAASVFGCVSNCGASEVSFSTYMDPDPYWTPQFWHLVSQTFIVHPLRFIVHHPNSSLNHIFDMFKASPDSFSRVEEITFRGVKFGNDHAERLFEALEQCRSEGNLRELHLVGCSGVDETTAQRWASGPSSAVLLMERTTMPATCAEPS